MKGKKIRRYRSGYLMRRRRRERFFKAIFFIAILALLIFLGYTIAKSVSNRKTESPTPESSEIVVSEISEESVEESVESEIIAEENTSDIRSILLPYDNMEDCEAFLKNVDKELFNAVTVELKTQTGQLLYPSEISLAKKSEAIAEVTFDHKEIAEKITEYGFTPIARIYALQDDYASHSSYSTSYIYDNQVEVTWLDNSPDQGGKSWLNPYMPKTLEYLAEVVTEICNAGYKTIIVNGIQYPNTANQKGMTFGENADTMTQKEALDKTFDAIKTEASKYSVSVIPTYKGVCYRDEMAQVYTVNPNEFKNSPFSPIIGNDISLLQYVIADANDIIPTINSAEQISSLKENGINQYIVG